MAAAVLIASEKSELLQGLRMTAEEYASLPETEEWYELIDGVVCMSPSPLPLHQKVAVKISSQIDQYLDTHPVGEVFVEVDVYLGEGPRGGDLVYRPDIVFLRQERVSKNLTRITGAPDLVVEIISTSSRRFDYETKKGDYERCGVPEYWIIDPYRKELAFYSLKQGRYVMMAPKGDQLMSEAIPGFELDLNRLRRSFE
ncbi:MAG TPA: Uma2 family endonuclease [Phycisphaerae bacterium]|nr:Uma2 family endonuclease [Phycisphaerae bacterium]